MILDVNMKKRVRVEEVIPVNKKENISSRKPKANFSKPSISTADRVIFLQRTIGNQAVERLINSENSNSISHTLLHNGNKIIQRYSVPGEIPCSEIVDWLNGNSPYAPIWAETRCNYSFNGNLKMTGKKTSNGYEITIKGHNKLTVSVSCPIDRPQWSPSNRANRNAEVAAWRRMRASLDAHEQRHRKIGQTWRAILEKRFRGVNFTVSGKDEDDAKNKARKQLNALQNDWRSDAQNAQDAIDPFKGAVLSCP